MRSRKINRPLNTIQTRVDGWVGAPNRVPAAVARIMARAMPQPTEVEIIRARMIARHRMLARNARSFSCGL